ncbi:MAG: hypothetical protein RLZZ609_1381 [Cyanobacteriota bacterium]|jgi:hypothetical protein
MAQRNPMASWRLQRRIAPLLMAPLLLAAVTGVAGRLGRSWFGLPKSVANRLFSIHAGGFLAEPLEPFYVLAMGLGLVGLLVTGAQLLPLLARRRPAQGERLLHGQLALVSLVPLLLTAVSGVLFRMLDAWSPLPAARFRWLMALHQVGWLGPQLKPVYVLLVGVGLVGLLATGGRMLIGPRRAVT